MMINNGLRPHSTFGLIRTADGAGDRSPMSARRARPAADGGL
jgi:hypothetical protein